MPLVAGVDIGNSTTEVVVARVEGSSSPDFLGSAIVATTGVKGTQENVQGVLQALEECMRSIGLQPRDVEVVTLNDATPVMADVAMETISETIITESTMIGHNPSTPGGAGMGVGKTILLDHLDMASPGESVIVIIPGHHDFDQAARAINEAANRGIDVRGAIVQRDDGVLISNRLQQVIPIVDEVKLIDRVPLGVPAAVEVAQPGRTVSTLSNPYGVATVFGLSPEETRAIVPLTRALIGNRSAVVIKTPAGDVQERRIPAGRLTLVGDRGTAEVDLELGADAVMEALERVGQLADVQGEPGTNVGGMLERVRAVMTELTGLPGDSVRIQDLLAVDTIVQRPVVGGVAGEFSSEEAVALAAMVSSSRLPMEQIADMLRVELDAEVVLGGVEAHMALLGALTTPGIDLPVAILDLGAGSTDAALADPEGGIKVVHLAGAGDMVSMLIDAELALDDRNLAEEAKRHPAGRMENLFLFRGEEGDVRFFEEPVDPQLFARTVVARPEGMIPLPGDVPVERVRAVRRRAKEKVFVRNALRALARVAPGGNVRLLDFVALVGGSALDFEVPALISDALAEYGVVVGTANVRGVAGPRNAVATGLVLAYAYQHGG